MKKSKVIVEVTAKLVSMMYNSIIQGNGIESFNGWLEDGEVFRNNMSEDDVKECMTLANEITPLVDNLVYKHLNIDEAMREEM